jgi:predicted RNase H-like HicB family nuclease
MQNYPIDVFWNDEDDIWIANVPDLALCAGHGSTPQEAVKEVEVAVEAWLEAAYAEGRAIPAPSLKKIEA